MVDWNAIKTEYITTKTSYRKLADKHKVSYVTIGTKGKEEGWPALKKQYANNTFTKTLDALTESAVSVETKIQEVAKKLLEKIETKVERTDPLKLTAKDVRALTGALKDIKDINGIKTDLDREEQRARINKLRKDTEKEETTDRTVEIVFVGGDTEEWSE